MKDTKHFIHGLSCAVFCLMASSSQASWRSTIYPADWLPPTNKAFATDKLIQDFSYAGYHRGEEPIPSPTGPIFDPVAYGADPTGAADSTTAIQSALTAASAAGGGVVFLPPGTFKLSLPSGKSSVLEIRGPGVVLRGSGPEQTFLLNTTTVMRGKSVIHFWNSATEGSPVYLTADLPNPTKRLPVANAAAFSVGDFVALQWDFTPEWVAEHDQEEWWNATDGYPAASRYQREVMAVNTSENWIEVDVPTRYTVKTRDNARLIKLGSLVEECGVENLSMGDVQHPGSEWEGEDYAVPGTSAYDVHGSTLIYIQKSRDCWVSNVKSYQAAGNTSTCNMLSNGIRIYKSFRVTLRDCLMQRPQYGGGGGNGYMYRLQQANDCLVEHCTAEFSRHGYVVSHAGTSGNVFHRCEDRISNHATGSSGSYITSLGDGSDNHMHFSHSSLWDQCTAFDSFWEAIHRGTVGNQGLTTAHSVYWNISGGGSQYPDKLVATEQGRYGYVIGTSGDVDDVINFDPARRNTAPLDHVEGEGLGESLYPQSLYLDQLSRRLDSGIRILSTGAGVQGSTLNVNINIGSVGYASTSDATVSVSGRPKYAGAFGSSFSVEIDAMKNVSTDAATLGDELLDGNIERDSNGHIGVVSGGIDADGENREGLGFTVDAAGLDPTAKIKITKIRLVDLNAGESFTVVNLATRDKVEFAGSSETFPEYEVDVSGLDLSVMGAAAGRVAALYAGDSSDVRVAGLTLDVVERDAILVDSVDSSEPGSTVGLDIDIESDGVAVSSSSEFRVAGYSSPEWTAGGTIGFLLDAMATVDTVADPGAKLTDGSIDRDSVGLIGVRHPTAGNNGINEFEGLQFYLDASDGIDASRRIQLTKINVKYVDDTESLTIVNRNNISKVLSVGGNASGSDVIIGSGLSTIDVSALNLWVGGGGAGTVAALFGNDMETPENGFRVTGFTLEVLPIDASLVFSEIESNGAVIELSWIADGLSGGVDIYRTTNLGESWDRIVTNYPGTNYSDTVLSTNAAAFYKAEAASW